MYKVLSIILAVALLAAGVAYGAERWSHNNTRKDLNNKIAIVEDMLQETATAHSRLAFENENIRASSSELQDIIDDRDEEVLALTSVNLRLKSSIIRIKDAKQTIVPGYGGSIVSGPSRECLDRFRVDFDKDQGLLRIMGHTLTNPPYAEVQVDWIGTLNLELVLTKKEDGSFRVYLDSEEAVPVELQLQVDPSILDHRWYERIGVGSDLALGATGIQLSLSAFYDVWPDFYVGPMIRMGYFGSDVEMLYGAVAGYYPWR